MRYLLCKGNLIQYLTSKMEQNWYRAYQDVEYPSSNKKIYISSSYSEKAILYRTYNWQIPLFSSYNSQHSSIK